MTVALSEIAALSRIALDNKNRLIPPPVQTPLRTSRSAVASKVVTPDPNYLAHDARNWLTILQVYCDLLRTSGAVASEYERWIDELSSAVERGHGLVASLLDSVQGAGLAAGPATTPSDSPHREGARDRRWPAASVDKRGAAPVADPLDIAAAVTRRLQLFQRLAGGNIHVEIDAAAGVGKVALPESVFERILHNLVSNALEAMPHGGRLRIAVRRGTRCNDNPRTAGPIAAPGNVRSPALKSKPSKPGDRRSAGTSTGLSLKTVLLRVHDTGEGISPECLPYIFEDGVSGKAAGKGDRPPRGFGLAIVRKLTERAGGAVRVRSRPGRGSCFEIELPQV